MSRLKIVLPSAILMAGFLVCSTASYGTVADAKQTKKSCKYCHNVPGAPTKKNAKELTEAGKYFQEHKNLDGYQEKK